MKRMVFGLAACGLLAGCETAGDMLVAGTMSGDWTGEAKCAPGLTLGMSLSMVYLPGGAVTATNELTLKGNAREMTFGTYALKGTYDVATYRLSLKPDGTWVKPPPPGIDTANGVAFPPIDTRLDPNSKSFTVEANKSCQAFVLTRK